MRTPFLAAWARPDPDNPWQQRLPIAQGAIQSQLGTVMDLYPTLVNLAGARIPDGHAVDGHDLARQLASAEPDPAREERFLMHYPHGHRSSYFTSLRLGNWKLVYHYFPDSNPAKTRYELFDLGADPYENVNLAAQRPQVVDRMMRAMIEQLGVEGALFPVDADGNEIRPVEPSP